MRLTYLILFLVLFFGTPASAFLAQEGCGAGSCTDCHALSKEDAREVLKDIQGEIQRVDPSAVPGLWRVELKTGERTLPLYLDYSKSYLISGNVIRLDDRRNLTEERMRKLNPIDPAVIPTDDALLLGNPQAKNRIIVFTDPHCPYCSKLHQVLKQAIKERPDLLFLIKLMPIKQSSLKISRTIACDKSLELLEDAFAGKTLPDPQCTTDVVEKNLTLARELGIRATPTLILPDGQIAPGYKDLQRLLELIDQSLPAPEAKKVEQPQG